MEDLIEENLATSKEHIAKMVSNMLREEFDMHSIIPENIDHHLFCISGEIAAAYAIYGGLVKAERKLEVDLKKTEARTYEKLRSEAGAAKLTAETLKRQVLLDRNLDAIQEQLGEAICARITQDGIIESLKTKREVLKTLAIRHHKDRNQE